MSSFVVCKICHTAETVDVDAERAIVPLESIGLFRCDECGARIVYGHVLPRIVVAREVDERGQPWVVVRHQDPRTKEDLRVDRFDPQFAAMFSRNLLQAAI